MKNHKRSFPPKVGNKQPLFFLLIILSLAAYLRIYKLGAHDLWFDEAIGVRFTENISEVYKNDVRPIPFGNPAGNKTIDSPDFKCLETNPPGYYLLLKLWIRCWGDSEIAVRSLSVIASLMTILLLYRLVANIAGNAAALFCALLTACAPFQVWYAQEARSYAVSTLLIVGAVYCLNQVVRTERRRWWAGFIICTAGALYHSYFAFFIIPSGWYIFLRHPYRKHARAWLYSNFAVCASFLPWLPIFQRQLQFVKETFWIAPASLRSLLTTLENFNLGYTATPHAYLISLPIFGYLCLRGIKKSLPASALFLFSFSLLPMGTVWLISRIVPVYLDRQLALYAPFYYALIAIGLASLPARAYQKIGIAGCIGLCLSSLAYYYVDIIPQDDLLHHQGAFIKRPFQPALRYIEKHWQQGDTVLHSNVSTSPSFRYYRKRLRLKQNNDTEHPRRLWLVSAIFPRKKYLPDHMELLRTQLSAAFPRIVSKNFSGIFVDLYSIAEDRQTWPLNAALSVPLIVPGDVATIPPTLIKNLNAATMFFVEKSRHKIIKVFSGQPEIVYDIFEMRKNNHVVFTAAEANLTKLIRRETDTLAEISLNISAFHLLLSQPFRFRCRISVSCSNQADWRVSSGKMLSLICTGESPNQPR